jgi:hypothetical protein
MRELSEDRRTVLARWASAAEQLTWEQPPRAVAEGEEGRFDWFPGGTLNLAVNAVHRHVPPTPTGSRCTGRGSRETAAR